MHPKVSHAIQEIDAAVFNGDTFDEPEAKKKLLEYIYGWIRQLEEPRTRISLYTWNTLPEKYKKLEFFTKGMDVESISLVLVARDTDLITKEELDKILNGITQGDETRWPSDICMVNGQEHEIMVWTKKGSEPEVSCPGDQCPECGTLSVHAKSLEQGGGVKCTNCPYWFCY